MNLEKLYKMQEELDNHILENARERNVVMSKEELLDKTILALLVEVAELANATRCFKHWSTKGPESKERLLDELADTWHFYLSIGNQMVAKCTDKPLVLTGYTLTQLFIKTYEKTSRLTEIESSSLFIRNTYGSLGILIYNIGRLLGFTNEEVEQAYLKKHEENYRRQREGY